MTMTEGIEDNSPTLGAIAHLTLFACVGFSLFVGWLTLTAGNWVESVVPLAIAVSLLVLAQWYRLVYIERIDDHELTLRSLRRVHKVPWDSTISAIAFNRNLRAGTYIRVLLRCRVGGHKRRFFVVASPERVAAALALMEKAGARVIRTI
ncbi:MAG TPA: hypothetical protein DCP20_04380 [Coriobacteriia bacterium]|nr:hypothetical protein [Coriobacteriia bacterium]